LPVDSSFTHAIAHTPAGPVENCRSFFFRSTSGGLPRRSRRSAPALTVSRIARRSLTLWPACLLTPRGSLFQECFSPIRCLLEPLQVLPVGATSYRAGFAPAGINKPFTAHRPTRVRKRVRECQYSHGRATIVTTCTQWHSIIQLLVLAVLQATARPRGAGVRRPARSPAVSGPAWQSAG